MNTLANSRAKWLESMTVWSSDRTALQDPLRQSGFAGVSARVFFRNHRAAGHAPGWYANLTNLANLVNLSWQVISRDLRHVWRQYFQECIYCDFNTPSCASLESLKVGAPSLHPNDNDTTGAFDFCNARSSCKSQDSARGRSTWCRRSHIGLVGRTLARRNSTNLSGKLTNCVTLTCSWNEHT